MRVLFLSSGPVSVRLREWLARREETVLFCENKLEAARLSGEEIDFAVSYNYRHILDPASVAALRGKSVNLHISFLPWNRGASPNIWSFLENTPSGVTIHLIDEGLDTGDVLLQKQIFFDTKNETLKSSYLRLHQEIQRLFIDRWADIRDGKIAPVKQLAGGSAHRARDLAIYEPILDYDDTVDVFLRKARQRASAVASS